MSDAVAKLRFDLLANLAGFSGAMKEAGDVADKTAQRFNRAFDSSKNAAARATKESEAWRAAMQKEGSFLAGSMSFGGGESAATKNAVRWNEMLPWGKSARVEISKEAALTAAELGNAKNGIAAKLAEAGKGLSGLAAGGMGGMMDTALGMLSAHPVGAAVAGVAGFALNHVRERENLVRETGRSAREFGALTEDVSALHAAGADDQLLGHLQRAIGEGNNAGLGKLGLDSAKLETEGLKDQLLDVAAKFNKLPSAVERATVAQELFGREGQEMIPVLQALKGKLADVAESKIVTAKEAAAVRASDKESNLASKTFNDGIERTLSKAGLVGGLSKNFNRGLTVAADFLFSDDATKRKHDAQFNKDDNDILMADVYAKQKEADDKRAALAAQEVERVKRMSDLSKTATQRVEDALADLKHPGSAARNQFERDAIAAGAGKKPGELAGMMDRYDSDQRRLELAQREKSLRDEGQAMHKSLLRPVDAFDEDAAHLSDIHDAGGLSDAGYNRAIRKRGRQTENELGIKNPEEDYAERLADLAQARGRVAGDKLHRAAADAADALMSGLDAPFMTSFEKFEAHMNEIGKRELDGSYSRDEADRRRKAETQGELAHAGIRRPLDEFKDSMEEITKLHDRGTITDDEYNRRERELRQQALSAATNDIHTVSPVAAMAAGGRELYAAMAGAQLNDPKTELAKETNKKLDKIVANTKPANAAKAKVLTR